MRRMLQTLAILSVVGVLGGGIVFFTVSQWDSNDTSMAQSDDSRLSAESDLSGISASRSPATLTNADEPHDPRRKKIEQASLAQENRVATGQKPNEEREEFSISGAVLDDAGALLPGARVEARLLRSRTSISDSQSVTSVILTESTDNLGRFSFSNLVEGEYELTATRGEDYFPASRRVRAGMENTELILQQVRMVQVVGQVSDKHGDPLEGVSIRALGTEFEVWSDGNGEYDILTTPVKPGTAPVLDFSIEDYENARHRIEGALDPLITLVQLDVQLEFESDEPAVTVTGQVVGPLDEAAVGVRVQLGSYKSRKNLSATTNKSGEFEFPEVEVGSGYRLRVLPNTEYEGHESEVFALGPEGSHYEVRLESADYAQLSGTVTDLAGKPLGGFALRLRGVGNSAQPPVTVETDGSGQFRLENLRAGEIRLESRSRPLLSASNIVLTAGQDIQLNIPMDWGDDWILGRVVDSEGQAVSGADIVVTWEDVFPNFISNSRRDVRSDLEGYFSVSNLGAKAYTLTIEAPGHLSVRVEHHIGGDSQEVLVQLIPGNASG